MRAGGDQAAGKGDLAAAVFYYAKAIDIAQTWSFSQPGRRDPALDVELFEAYARSIEIIRGTRPEADVINTGSENAKYTLGMMVAVAHQYAREHRPVRQLDRSINRLITATGLTVEQ